MDKVLARASDLAAEKGQPFQIGKTTPATTTPSTILSAEGTPLGVTTTPAQIAKYPGSSLHDMKMAFDDLINNPERFGIGAAEAKAIGNTRKQFLSWAEEKAPDYRVARETFAQQSAPINQMKVGQYLEGKLKPALGEETASLRAAGFAGAVENAPTTLKTATGQTRFEKLSEILTPDQIAAIESVRADLARAKLTEQQAKAARGAGPDVGLAGTAVLGSLRAPGLISTITTVANDIMRRLQGKLDQKLAIELATEMLDPAAAATAMEKALARENLVTRSFSNVRDVVEALKSGTPQVLVSDIRMPGESGLELLHTVKQRHPSLPVIVMTAFSDLDSAVAAFQGGAFEYLAKPFDLLVGFRGRLWLLEVKTDKGKLTKEQLRDYDLCTADGLPVAIVKTAGEALRAIGAVR
jgi:CheY-like chemotaxis protein